jgi:hypothetical protein
MSTSRKTPLTQVEKLTAVTNRVLGERGCSYCRKFKPFDQVRIVRTRFGVARTICDACQTLRRNNPKGRP